MATKKYQSDKGTIHTLNMSKAKADVANNTEPESDVDSDILPKISKSNREYGLRPRGVRLYRDVTAGTGANAITKRYNAFLPILKKETLGDTNFSKEKDVTYKGSTWKIGGLVQEDY
jgi:hypothetical protein